MANTLLVKLLIISACSIILYIPHINNMIQSAFQNVPELDSAPNIMVSSEAMPSSLKITKNIKNLAELRISYRNQQAKN